MPYMLTADDRLVIERLAEMHLLPSPEVAKVVPLKKMTMARAKAKRPLIWRKEQQRLRREEVIAEFAAGDGETRSAERA